jgi:hypothetical protein
MKRFHCSHCQNLVVLENDHCTACGNRLAFVPEHREMVSWGARDTEADTERTLGPSGTAYRLCRNYVEHNICNWAVAADEPSGLCVSCRLTSVIPDLAVPGNLLRWYRLEAAKRRLVVGLMQMSLPLDATAEPGAFPLVFEFKADEITPEETKPVLTGHDDGLITINVAEADDDERERRRVAMHEPYRTLVGHFRHEVGHYYWDRLIKPSKKQLKDFRAMFGDENLDYAQALAAHYENGPPADWNQNFISAYASTHPWEDWAETWAHYLHMLDSLETAHEGGLSLKPKRRADPSFSPPGKLRTIFGMRVFRSMLERWLSLTYILNDLNRGLGLQDAYPFVLSETVVAKLEFVHRTIERHRKGSR